MEIQKSSDLLEFVPSFILNENSIEEDYSDTDNGLCFNNVYVPEEILLHILSYVDTKELLNKTLVCRKWNNMIKSYSLWSSIYKRKYNCKPKILPWYVYYCLLAMDYFDTNLVKNGNGQNKFNHWKFRANGGDQCIVEDIPGGCEPLPIEQPEFCNQTSCFATSYGSCCKAQEIMFGNSKLFQFVLDTYKPHMYLSEWTAGRFDCGCIYKLKCKFITATGINKSIKQPQAINQVEQWQGSKWKKMEITITDYPESIKGILFHHEGRDTQYWAGHYGSKMAGGVYKLLFDSIQPLKIDSDGNVMPKKYLKVNYECNGDMVEHHPQPCIEIMDFEVWDIDSADYEDEDDSSADSTKYSFLERLLQYIFPSLRR